MNIRALVYKLTGRVPLSDQEDDKPKLSHNHIKEKMGAVVGKTVIAKYGPDLECLPAHGFAEELRLGFQRVLTDSIREARPEEDPYELANETFNRGIVAGFQDFGMVFALSDTQKDLVEEAATDYYMTLQNNGIPVSLENVILPNIVIPLSGGAILLRGA